MAAGVTITVRLIRSFEHRNIRPVVIKNVQVDMTVQEFQDIVMESIKTYPGLVPPVRNYGYDTLKIMHQAHGFKCNDPVINLERDLELVLKPGETLKDSSVNNETELSFFKLSDYLNYRQSVNCSVE